MNYTTLKRLRLKVKYEKTGRQIIVFQLLKMNFRLLA